MDRSFDHWQCLRIIWVCKYTVLCHLYTTNLYRAVYHYRVSYIILIDIFGQQSSSYVPETSWYFRSFPLLALQLGSKIPIYHRNNIIFTILITYWYHYWFVDKTKWIRWSLCIRKYVFDWINWNGIKWKDPCRRIEFIRRIWSEKWSYVY